MADLVGDLGDDTKNQAMLTAVLDRALLAFAAALVAAGNAITAFVSPAK